MQIIVPEQQPPLRLPAGVHLVLADNPGPMTLDGTNTWVLGTPESDAVLVIDPGPALDSHLAAIRSLGRPAAIVLTHHHHDHAESAAALAAEFDIPVYAALEALAIRSAPLVDGDTVSAAGWRLDVIASPGHTSDSVCLATDGGIFTGDTLLGGSTTIIAPPSGSLAEYFATMTRLGAMRDHIGLPGHGPVFPSVGEWALQNAEYRELRLAQLAQLYSRVVADSPQADATAVLATVAAEAYGNGAAVAEYIEVMTAAQLDFLAERGDIDRGNG